jgi:hypothetical protein
MILAVLIPVEFADGANRRESGACERGGQSSSREQVCNRVGRAVRESATFMRCAGCGRYMDGRDCDTAAGRRDG